MRRLFGPEAFHLLYFFPIIKPPSHGYASFLLVRVLSTIARTPPNPSDVHPFIFVPDSLAHFRILFICSKAVAEKCDKAEAEKAAKCNKAEAKTAATSGSCCKTDAAKACADKAEKKCSKSAGSAKTSI